MKYIIHSVFGLLFLAALVVGVLAVSNAHQSTVNSQSHKQASLTKELQQKALAAAETAKATAAKIQAEAKHQCDLQYAYYNNLPLAVKKTLAPPGCPQ